MPLRKDSPTSSPSSILIVDDNKLGVSARKSVLEELGHKCVTASNGVDALELFAGRTFDLVVTDYKMPRMDGLELIKGIRRQTPEVPVILISGFVDSLGLSEENTGADVVIMKSANEVSHLVRAVARLLRKKAGKKPVGSEAAARVKRKMV